MHPGRRRYIELMTGAVDLVSGFQTQQPGWTTAARMVLGDDYLRDVLLAQIVRDKSWDTAVLALGSLERDAKGNRDASIAVCLWLGGNVEEAVTVAGMADGNRLAGLVEILAITGIDSGEWGRRLVDSLTQVSPDPAMIGPALRPR